VHALIKTNVASTLVAHAILQMPFVSIDEDTALTDSGRRSRASPAVDEQASTVRSTRRIAADLTRPFRRFELGLIFRQELTGPINVVDAFVDIEIAQASADDVERAASLNRFVPAASLFRWLFKTATLHRARGFDARGPSLGAASARGRRRRHDSPCRRRRLSL
jgi:hypothetical protein